MARRALDDGPSGPRTSRPPNSNRPPSSRPAPPGLTIASSRARPPRVPCHNARPAGPGAGAEPLQVFPGRMAPVLPCPCRCPSRGERIAPMAGPARGLGGGGQGPLPLAPGGTGGHPPVQSAGPAEGGMRFCVLPSPRSEATQAEGRAKPLRFCVLPSTKLSLLCASARSQGPWKGRSEGPRRGWVGEGSRLQWPPCKGPVKRSRSPDPRGEAHRQMGKPRRYTVTLGSTREAKAPTRAARRWAHAALD